MLISVAVLLFILIGLLTVFVLFFVSRRFSPIPYFPSNGRDIEKIVKLLALKNNQILYDLGAGDGVVIFSAARATRHPLPSSLPRFVAVEINPVLIVIMRIRRLFHPARDRISIVKSDIFTITIPRSSYLKTRTSPLFFMYISPWFMEKTILNLLKQFKSIELVTYFYPAPPSKKYRAKLHKKMKNVHTTYRYTITRMSKV